MNKGNELFLQHVSKKILPGLISEATTKCKRLNAGHPPYTNHFDALFHVYLSKFLNNWGETYAFLEGNVSEFYKALETLKNQGIDLDPAVPAEPAPAPKPEAAKRNLPPNANAQAQQQHRARETLSKEAIESQAQALIEFAAQLEPAAWATDRETVGQIYSQLKNLQANVTSAINEYADHPDADISKLLTFNEKLSELHNLVVKAAKGDIVAARKIPKIHDPNAIVPEGNF